MSESEELVYTLKEKHMVTSVGNDERAKWTESASC